MEMQNGITGRGSKGNAPSGVHEKYQDILQKDALTGINNRRGFYSSTAALIQGNPEEEYVICCINIDKFKLVNDLFGTYEGDKLLVYMANHLRDFVGDYGTIARLTADNFAICLPNEPDIYEKVMTTIDDWFEDYPLSVRIINRCGFYHVHDPNIQVSIMCDRANLAILEIKGSYEKNYAVYDEKIRKRILQEQEILNEMKTALETRQFTVYYQPKFNMESGKLIGSEALVRWIHPEKGLISPGVFVPVFEKNGFISALDQYVWECVCEDLRQWIDDGYTVCPVSINVSRAELYNKDLTSFLVNLVEKYNIPQNLIQLEITESAVTDDPDQMIRMVMDLKSSGFVILMDDFGSGYSSLNTLKDVPVDVLKLDLKFLYNMDHNVKANYILKSVVEMAMRLDLIVIAEGVETETQAEFLKSIGCIRAQGYLYAKPMPKKELEIFLSDPNKVTASDDDARIGIVNIDDMTEGFHSDDELTWYRMALVQMKAMLFQYDLENDILMIYDMKMEDGSKELSRIEIASFKQSVASGAYIYEKDAAELARMINDRDIKSYDMRLRGVGGMSQGYKWYRMDGKVLTTSDGTPRAIVGALRDISNEKAEDMLLEILSVFEGEKDERKILDRILDAVNYGVAANSTGLIFTKARGVTEMGGVALTDDGTRKVIYDPDVIKKIDSQILKVPANEYGLRLLSITDYDRYGSDIQEFFFSEGARHVAVFRAELNNQMTAVLFTSYSAADKQFSNADLRHLGEMSKSVRNNLSKLYTDKFERENMEMYSYAFRNSNVKIWEWDIETGLLHRSANAIDDDGMGEWVQNVPDIYIDSKTIHPDYVDDYKNAYNDLRNGKNAVVMVKKILRDATYVWLHIDYTVIFDAEGNPIKAIGLGEDVNQLYQNQTKERLLLLDRRMDKTVADRMIFKVDFDEDRITEVRGDFKFVKKDKSYSELIKQLLDEYIHGESKESFKKYSSVESVVKEYVDGNRCFTKTYKHLDENGKLHWKAVNVDVFTNVNSHLCAVVRLRSLDKCYEYEKYVKGDVKWDEVLCIYENDSFNDMVRGVIENEKDIKGALMVVDMDKSSIIKDALGQKYVTELMNNVVAIIKSMVPDDAVIGRLYDDRFGIFIPNQSTSRATFVIYRELQKSLFSAFSIGNINYVLSASIGFVFTEYYNGDYERLMSDALDDLILAKSHSSSKEKSRK